jgi:hypothetical protein
MGYKNPKPLDFPGFWVVGAMFFLLVLSVNGLLDSWKYKTSQLITSNLHASVAYDPIPCYDKKYDMNFLIFRLGGVDNELWRFYGDDYVLVVPQDLVLKFGNNYLVNCKVLPFNKREALPPETRLELKKLNITAKKYYFGLVKITAKTIFSEDFDLSQIQMSNLTINNFIDHYEKTATSIDGIVNSAERWTKPLTKMANRMPNNDDKK